MGVPAKRRAAFYRERNRERAAKCAEINAQRAQFKEPLGVFGPMPRHAAKKLLRLAVEGGEL